MRKDDITATKSVSFHPAQIESHHDNDHSHDVTQTHASSNDTMMEHSMDDSATKSEGDMHSRRKRRRKVSEFAIDKMAKYKRVGETIQKYSANARLCLITMPYPRKKFEWWEYSHIIHDLTPKDVPSIFVRGTQDQVLTFAF
jgi:hypothetical protein